MEKFICGPCRRPETELCAVKMPLLPAAPFPLWRRDKQRPSELHFPSKKEGRRKWQLLSKTAGILGLGLLPDNQCNSALESHLPPLSLSLGQRGGMGIRSFQNLEPFLKLCRKLSPTNILTRNAKQSGRLLIYGAGRTILCLTPEQE